MPELQRRIVGTELELGMTHSFDGNLHMPLQYEHFRVFFRHLPEEAERFSPGSGDLPWFANGGRMYVDYNAIPEYCTPETSIDKLVVAERAGERIAMSGLAGVARKFYGINAASLTRRIVDDHGNTFGHHLNVLTKRSSLEHINHETAHLLMLHLTTSSALFGLGHIDNLRNHEYSFWQKFSNITTDFGAGTTGDNKPLINLRDEPHAHADQWRRLHLTNMDSHISPWATRMAAGTISLVMRAIEQGKGDELRLVSDENTMFVDLGYKTTIDTESTFRTGVREKNGEKTKMNAPEIQRAIIEIVKTCEMHPEEVPILEEWIRAIDDWDRNIMLLRDRSDAIAKLALLRNIQKRQGLEGMRHESLKKRDKQYDQIFFYKRPEAAGEFEEVPVDYMEIHKLSSAWKMRNSEAWFGKYEPSEKQVSKAMNKAPNFTRAKIREKMIKKHKEIISYLNWDMMDLYENVAKKKVLLKDPYATEIPADAFHDDIERGR